ncbi:MAG: DUF922 domain-containing protein [Bacteroidales bacterium]
MKFLSIFILIITLSSFSTIKDNKILWNKDKPLTWNDFQGIPKKSSQRWAMTNSGIELETSFENNTLTITVGAYFIKNKSWVKKEALSDSLLLEHEQVHFNITELFARKFRQKLRAEKLSSKNAEKKLHKMYSDITSKLNKYQNLYDKQTNHHINQTQQKKWNTKIAQELTDLEDFQNIIVKKQL